ncbi:DMT family transporter [Candidatus Roizmanbacteria bacterium]|nr:DMT family transporter [Candidatus Roizmanbacteria bacterium]
MIGIVLALLCAVFIAFSQLSLRKSYKELPPSIAFFFDAIFGLLIWVPLAFFMGISEMVAWSEAIMFAVISAILSEAIVFYALSKGELAVTATVLATYPVYTVIFSRFLINEVLSLPLMLFVIFAIAGSIIASMPDKFKKEEFKLTKGIAWPFIAAICIGLSDTISKGYINRSNDFSFLLSLGFVQIPVAIAYLRIEKQSLVQSVNGVIRSLKTYKFALLGGLFNIIGTGFLWLSFSFAPASIASPITGSNGALTVLLSRMILKEKISIRKYVGILLAFIGII